MRLVRHCSWFCCSSRLLLALLLGQGAVAGAAEAPRKYYSPPMRFRYSDATSRKGQVVSSSDHQHHHQQQRDYREAAMGSTDDGLETSSKETAEESAGRDHSSEHHVVESHEDREEVNRGGGEDEAAKGHSDEEVSGSDHERERRHEDADHEDEEHRTDHHKGERAEKRLEYRVHGNHHKGHSTKGRHDVFEKDEYENKREFYDEFSEDDERDSEGAQDRGVERDQAQARRSDHGHGGHRQAEQHDRGELDRARHREHAAASGLRYGRSRLLDRTARSEGDSSYARAGATRSRS